MASVGSMGRGLLLCDEAALRLRSPKIKLGQALIEAMEEALAWKRGEKALPVKFYNLMPPEKIKAIRKSVARSPRAFQQRFGIPARTLEGWEQGLKRPDVAAHVLLTVIARSPSAVEEALRAEAEAQAR